MHAECPDLHDAGDGVGESTLDEEEGEGQHQDDIQVELGEDFQDTEEGSIALPEAGSVLSPSDEERSDEIGYSK